MLDLTRKYKRIFEMNKEIKDAYRDDCRQYIKWQYNNPKIRTKGAFEAKILRQAHVLEKGMSLKYPREKFGVQKAVELLDFIEEYETAGFQICDSIPVINSLSVLGAYVSFHKKRGFEPMQVEERLEKYKNVIPNDELPYGVIQTNVAEMSQHMHGEFPEFFCSRHSVRWFAEKPVSVKDIQKVISLAMHAPSACNRQSPRAYFYTDAETNDALGKLILGNTGFDQDVKNYIVVTSDMSAFYDAFERNQVYIDGGIFGLAIVEACHYYGIASCILQNGEVIGRNDEFRHICKNIPENEKIILFIAVGYYPENFTYASSHRKKLEEVLIIGDKVKIETR